MSSVHVGALPTGANMDVVALGGHEDYFVHHGGGSRTMERHVWWCAFFRLPDGRWECAYLRTEPVPGYEFDVAYMDEEEQQRFSSVSDTPRGAFEALINMWEILNNGKVTEAMSEIVPACRVSLDNAGHPYD